MRSRNRKRGPHLSRFEREVRDGLTRHGLFFQAELPSLAGKPDIVLEDQKIAIFLDGCFWHCCPTHWKKPTSNQGYWLDRRSSVRRRDREVTEALQASGWVVERFWEHESTHSIVKEIVELEAGSSLLY